MAQGTIKRLTDKGFGFIDTGRGDLFFHSSSLQGVTFDQLQEGQKVSFEEGFRRFVAWFKEEPTRQEMYRARS